MLYDSRRLYGLRYNNTWTRHHDKSDQALTISSSILFPSRFSPSLHARHLHILLIMADPENYRFAQRDSCHLSKYPGEIDGQGFVCENLYDCTVHLLDVSAQIQVDDCENCAFVIGPCEGSVFFRDCKNCTVTVASRQLRTRNCEEMTFYTYCASNPSIESSKALTFAPFNASYPGLTAHFARANLDAGDNRWDQIHDFTPPEDGELNYELSTGDGEDEGGLPWQRINGRDDTPPDCPAPLLPFDDAFDGMKLDVAPAQSTTAPTPMMMMDEDDFFSAGLGGGAPPAAAIDNDGDDDDDVSTAVAARQRERIMQERARKEELAEAEGTKRTEIKSTASHWLVEWNRERKLQLENKHKHNRQAQQILQDAVVALEGASFWERMSSMIDAKATKTKSGVDLGRFKDCLFAAKAINMQIA